MPKVRLAPGDFAVLTLTEPWATLCVLGEKTWETRGWPTAYRGLLLIQAAKSMPRYAQEACLVEPFEMVLERYGIGTPNCRPEDVGGAKTQRLFQFKFAAIIGAVDLGDSQHAEKIAAALERVGSSRARQELAFGNFAAGRWAFRFARPQRFAEPVPVRGSLGIWTLSKDSTEAAAVRAQLGVEVARG